MRTVPDGSSSTVALKCTTVVPSLSNRTGYLPAAHFYTACPTARRRVFNTGRAVEKQHARQSGI